MNEWAWQGRCQVLYQVLYQGLCTGTRARLPSAWFIAVRCASRCLRLCCTHTPQTTRSVSPGSLPQGILHAQRIRDRCVSHLEPTLARQREHNWRVRARAPWPRTRVSGIPCAGPVRRDTHGGTKPSAQRTANGFMAAVSSRAERPPMSGDIAHRPPRASASTEKPPCDTRTKPYQFEALRGAMT
jgi:hypothetical protein